MRDRLFSEYHNNDIPKSKDLDFAVEAAGGFGEMKDTLLVLGYTIFQEREEFLTIRACRDNQVADYALCRTESGYSDGRHPDEVKPATIHNDLYRRDFTINAIARLEDDSL